MILINLLPVREWKKKELVRQQISLYLLIMTLLAVSLLGVYIYFENFLGSKERQKEDLAKRKQELAYVENALREQKQYQDNLEKRFKTIENLQLSRGNIVEFLNRFVRNVPNDKVWIEEIDYKGSIVSIKGIAMDNQSVALFMKNLEKSEIFKNIALISTDRKLFNQLELMSFTIQTNLDFSSLTKEKEVKHGT